MRLQQTKDGKTDIVSDVVAALKKAENALTRDDLESGELDNVVIINGVWSDQDNSVTFYDGDNVLANSTVYEIINIALMAEKQPILCITNTGGDWEAYFYICRSDSTEYQFSSFETDSQGTPLLGIVWVRADAAGYQGISPATVIDVNSKLSKSGGTITGQLTLNGKLILSSATYGNTLPSSGVAGQVFFKKL